MIAAICLGGASIAFAQETQPRMMGGPQGEHEHGAMQHQRMDPVAGAQHRLDALAKKLYLKPSQQGAWNTYTNAMLAHAKEHLQDRQKWMASRPAGPAEMSTPEKMEMMANMMRANADKLSRAASETKTFYAVLSPEQQTIFDLSARQMWRGQMQHGMDHR